MHCPQQDCVNSLETFRIGLLCIFSSRPRGLGTQLDVNQSLNQQYTAMHHRRKALRKWKLKNRFDACVSPEDWLWPAKNHTFPPVCGKREGGIRFPRHYFITVEFYCSIVVTLGSIIANIPVTGCVAGSHPVFLHPVSCLPHLRVKKYNKTSLEARMLCASRIPSKTNKAVEP